MDCNPANARLFSDLMAVSFFSSVRTPAFTLAVLLILGAGGIGSGCTKDKGANGDTAASGVSGSASADKSGKVDGKMPPSVKIWDTLSQMEPAMKEPPKEVQVLIGTAFKVSGYPVINEAATDGVSDFLITPIPGGCVHVPPPPPGYIMHVTLPKGKKVVLQSMYNAIRVHGTLSLNTKKEDKDFYAYEFKADLVEKYTDDE